MKETETEMVEMAKAVAKEKGAVREKEEVKVADDRECDPSFLGCQRRSPDSNASS